jgi:hypothetical protein
MGDRLQYVNGRNYQRIDNGLGISFNPPGVAGEVIMHIGFFGGEEVLIPAAAEGEGPVILRAINSRSISMPLNLFSRTLWATACST